MSTKFLVVNGEASETDSDEENRTLKISPNGMAQSVQGAAITGEDSESDHGDNNIYLTRSLRYKSPRENKTQSTPKREKFNSLLHTKLRENNRSIEKDMDDYLQTTITDASDKLNTVEQNLLRSQLTLQGALTSLKALNSNSNGIRNKLRDVLTARFLNNVNTD